MIKFRVWDMRLREYITDVSADDYLELTFTNKDYWEFKAWNHEDFLSLEIEPSTGLFDKNGKEIFVDDIVFIPREESNYQIIYQREEAMFIMFNNFEVITFDNYSGKDVEVIGNINENKELLENE